MLKKKDGYYIEMLFSQDLIRKRISEIALRITGDYADKNTQ